MAVEPYKTCGKELMDLIESFLQNIKNKSPLITTCRAK